MDRIKQFRDASQSSLTVLNQWKPKEAEGLGGYRVEVGLFGDTAVHFLADHKRVTIDLNQDPAAVKKARDRNILFKTLELTVANNAIALKLGYLSDKYVRSVWKVREFRNEFRELTEEGQANALATIINHSLFIVQKMNASSEFIIDYSNMIVVLLDYFKLHLERAYDNQDQFLAK